MFFFYSLNIISKLYITVDYELLLRGKLGIFVISLSISTSLWILLLQK